MGVTVIYTKIYRMHYCTGVSFFCGQLITMFVKFVYNVDLGWQSIIVTEAKPYKSSHTSLVMSYMMIAAAEPL